MKFKYMYFIFPTCYHNFEIILIIWSLFSNQSKFIENRLVCCEAKEGQTFDFPKSTILKYFNNLKYNDIFVLYGNFLKTE